MNLTEILKPLDSATEDFILKDTSLVAIKSSKEYATNDQPTIPTNTICTSLFSRERIASVPQYIVAYVKETKGLKDVLRRTRQMLGGNFDPKDPVFISLKEELERLFRKKKLNEVTKADIETNSIELDSIYTRAKELERENMQLGLKYEHDAKYARLHKRLLEKGTLQGTEQLIYNTLSKLKEQADVYKLQNSKMLDNVGFVNKVIGRLIVQQKQDGLELDSIQEINHPVVEEYMNEHHGKIA